MILFLAPPEEGEDEGGWRGGGGDKKRGEGERNGCLGQRHHVSRQQNDGVDAFSPYYLGYYIRYYYYNNNKLLTLLILMASYLAGGQKPHVGAESFRSLLALL